MTPGSSGHWTYNLAGDYGEVYDVVIAGRRNDSEYWATFPAKYTYSEVGKSTSIPMASYSGWDYKTISY